MLSPDQVASQGPGGFLNLNGGPTDPYYALADGSSYPSLAAACAAVPTAARRNRTVSVVGSEYQWLESDLSDAGLLLKSPASSGGGGGGSASSATIVYEVTQDGAQTIQLPATATGIAQVQKQTPNPTSDGSAPTTGQTTDVNDKHTSFDAASRILTISEDAGLVDGQTVTVRYLYGGASTGGDGGTGDIDASRVKGVLAEDNFPPLTQEKVEQLTDLINNENAQRGPLVLVAQPLLATPVDGALEFDGVNFYKTVGGVRTQF